MLARWFNCLILGLITLLNFSAVTAVAAEKKNVCAMTINSSDEIDLFKKHLSPEQFNFIELTKIEDKKSSAGDSKWVDTANPWLKASCRQGIKCDVLVISGHFGGSFFGNSDINLPLEELETASCDSACSGILHEPKEVFLFGCNTLAGKERDSRTPEQYARVLVNDGFTETQAQQIAAFRYSAIGSSFSDRMARVFAKVPRIYGFTSIAPSGKTVAPHLTRYLKDLAPTYFDQLTNMTSTPNTALRERLKGQPLAQVVGTSNTNTPVCYIQSEKTSAIGKLQYIQEVLEKGGALELAPYLSDYFANLDEKKLNPAERRMLEKVYEHTAGREKLASFVSRPIKGLLKPQVDTLNLMYNINWISEKDYNQRMDTLVLHPLYNKDTLLTRDLVDQMCSLEAVVRAVDVRRIPNEFWNKDELYTILFCLKAGNEELIERVSMQMFSLAQTIAEGKYNKRNHDIEMIRTMLSVFTSAKYLHDGVIDRLVTLVGIDGLTSYVAMFAEESNLTSEKLRHALEKLIENDTAKSTAGQLARSAVMSLGRDDQNFVLARYEDLIAGRGKFTAYSFLPALEKSVWFRNKVFQDIAETKNDARLRPLLKLVYGLFKYTDAHASDFEKIVLNESLAPNTRMMALDIMTSGEVDMRVFVSLLKKVFSSKTHYQLRAAAWTLLRVAARDGEDETPLFLAQETHPVMRRALERYTIPYMKDVPFQHHQKYHLGKADFSSPLLLSMQSGKEPYTLLAKHKSDQSTGNFENRTIILGVDEANYKENQEHSFATYNSVRIIYDVKRNSILGLLGDTTSLHGVTITENEDLILTRNTVDTITILGTAVKIDPASGKIVQDYSEALHKAQKDFLAELKNNPENKKYIEATRDISFEAAVTTGKDMSVTFVAKSYDFKLSAKGTLHFTPGANGKGTVQIKDVQVDFVDLRNPPKKN